MKVITKYLAAVGLSYVPLFLAPIPSARNTKHRYTCFRNVLSSLNVNTFLRFLFICCDVSLCRLDCSCSLYHGDTCSAGASIGYTAISLAVRATTRSGANYFLPHNNTSLCQRNLRDGAL